MPTQQNTNKSQFIINSAAGLSGLKETEKAYDFQRMSVATVTERDQDNIKSNRRKSINRKSQERKSQGKDNNQPKINSK